MLSVCQYCGGEGVQKYLRGCATCAHCRGTGIKHEPWWHIFLCLPFEVRKFIFDCTVLSLAFLAAGVLWWAVSK